MTAQKSSAPPAHRTTRHHRVDERFLELLEEDFGTDLLVMCATYGWSYDDTKTRPLRPTTETQTA